jgi:hypothetical protein
MPTFLDLVEALERVCPNMHGLAVSRGDGPESTAFWDPYSGDEPQHLFSVSKSFTAMAAMFAVQEGIWSLDDYVADAYPDKLPSDPSEHLRAMTLQDLLTMSAGHAEEPPVWDRPDDWAAEFFAKEVPHRPGTHFLYNTPATYMVAHWLNRLTGEDLVAYLQPRLFKPLGIDGSRWMRAPGGVRAGGFGLSLRLNDLHRFGRFLLHRGEGLLEEELIDLATSPVVSNGSNPDDDWNQGYGFQFWRSRQGAYRGDGAFGQFIVVQPETGWVVAIHSETSDMQSILSVLWEVLPGLEVEGEQLQRSLPGTGPTADVPSIAGNYLFEPNELGLDLMTISMRTAGYAVMLNDELFAAPWGGWSPLFERKRFSLDLGDSFEQLASPVSTFGSFRDGTLRLRLAYVRTPFSPELSVRFEGDEVEVGFEGSLFWFGPTEHAPVVGIREV